MQLQPFDPAARTRLAELLDSRAEKGNTMRCDEVQAFMLAFEYSPQWMKDEAYAMAEQYLPKPSGCLDSGEPVYSLQDIAKHHDVPYEQAEQDLLTMMQQREELGLSTDGVLINAHVNRIQ